jgi:hypothetical protein
MCAHFIVTQGQYSRLVTPPLFFVDKSTGNIYMYRQLISYPVGFHGFYNGPHVGLLLTDYRTTGSRLISDLIT